MTSLIKKNLVSKDNKLPAKYRLTEDGRNLASKMLHETNENTVPINQSGKIIFLFSFLILMILIINFIVTIMLAFI